MGLQYKSTKPLSALAAVLFGVYVGVAAELILQITHLLKLQLTFVPPTIVASLAFVHALAVQYGIALGFSLPNFNVNFGIALQYELGIVIGLLAALEGILDASIIGYAYLGSAQQLGPAISGAVANGWPDGTSALSNVTAYLFVASASGPHTSSQVQSATIVAPATPAPAPTNPAPPAGSYPPPQAYEAGLASISFPSQISPSTVYPASPATATLTIDNSVATGIGKITGITMTSNGSGYSGNAYALISDTVNIVAITPGSPVVLQLPNALSIPIGHGFGITVAGVTPTDINGPAFAKVLTSTTIALYQDQAMSIPITGVGPYTGGNVTGGGTGAAARATMGGGNQTGLKGFFVGLQWPTVGPALVGGPLTFSAMLAGAFALIAELLAWLSTRKGVLLAVTLQASLAVLPPTINASITLLGKIALNLTANLGIKPPSFGVALAAQIGIIGKLVAAINAQLAYGDVSLEVWEYQGNAQDFASAISTGPGSTGWHDGTSSSSTVAAAIVGLTTTAAAGAFGTIFGGI